MLCTIVPWADAIYIFERTGKVKLIGIADHIIRSIPSNWDITSRIFAFTKLLADSIIMTQQEKRNCAMWWCTKFSRCFCKSWQKQENRPGRCDTVRRLPYGIRTLEENKNEDLSQTIRKGNSSNERRRQAGSRSDTTACLSAFLLRQHRTIPALRLKHHSGGCGTASALPKCSIIHKVLSALLA